MTTEPLADPWSAVSAPPRRRRSRQWLLLVGVLVAVVLLAVTVVVVRVVHRLSYRSLDVPSGAMLPTLQIGDHVIVQASVAPTRGDVVVLEHTIPGMGPGLLVKRVVGVGGDTVENVSGTGFVVNGVPESGSYSPGVMVPSMVVPAGELFVVGDNRADSYDSRYFGAVPTTDIQGTVVAIDSATGRHAVPDAPRHPIP